MKRWLVWALLVGAAGIGAYLLFCHFSTRVNVPPPDYWPTEGWKRSLPEDQGMYPDTLADAFQSIRDLRLHVHTLLVIRHGYLVAEANVYPFTEDTPQSIHSITKSIVATLVGIAIDKGYIESVDEPVLSFFPELEDLEREKRAITIRHLLTMTSGLDWPEHETPYGDPENIQNKMLTSEDPIRFVLERPMVASPGKVFNYNSGTWQVLVAILARATGMDPYQFAKEHLFTPLGISRVAWERDNTGLPLGGSGIRMRPRDLAKIGLLYLQRGAWEGKQVVSAKWVDQATRAHVNTDMDCGYGYGWWVYPPKSLFPRPIPRIFWAAGGTGDRLFLVPKSDMIIVQTGALDAQEAKKIVDIHLTLATAVEADYPLLPAPSGQARLRALISKLEHPPQVDQLQPPQVFSDLPPLAHEISGRNYVLESNSYFRSFTFRFNPDSAYLTLITRDGLVLSLPINLDGVMRFQEFLTPYFHVGLTGAWEDGNVFVAEYEQAEADLRLRLRLEFEDNLVHCTITDLTSDYSEKVTGKAR